MSSFIYSKTTDKGMQSFYLVNGNEKYFLFTQKFFKGVKKYFHNKVVLSDALNISKSNNDTALIRTKKKLPLYIKYIEKELNIAVLDSTAKKKEIVKKKFYKRKNYYDMYSYEYNIA